MSLPVDEKLIKKIYELIGEGVHQVREMERHLRIFVKNELFKDSPLPVIIIFFLKKSNLPKFCKPAWFYSFCAYFRFRYFQLSHS